MKGLAGRRLAVAVALILVTGAASWLAIAVSFDPLILAGSSQPATIWGPAAGVGGTAMTAAVLVGLAAAMRGRWRLATLVVWMLFLAAATHRIVERSDGLIVDRWLGVAVQTLPADPADESAPGRCAVGPWLARCNGGGAYVDQSVPAAAGAAVAGAVGGLNARPARMGDAAKRRRTGFGCRPVL